ncbi:hypothetical protein M8J76_015049 [Diaphorina citri]|nr:hypothetical protein M8J76_015049 [Diaphorina citri]
MVNSRARSNTSVRAISKDLPPSTPRPGKNSPAGGKPTTAGGTTVAGGCVKKTKHKRSRCAQCNVKLTVCSSFTCRCRKLFCPRHRHPEEHACTFDYKAYGRHLLAATNPLVVADKVVRI